MKDNIRWGLIFPQETGDRGTRWSAPRGGTEPLQKPLQVRWPRKDKTGLERDHVDSETRMALQLYRTLGKTPSLGDKAIQTACE